MNREDKTKEELIEEVRLLQERIAKAERLGYRPFQSILDAYPQGAYVTNDKYEIEYLNAFLKKEFGPVNNRKCFEYFHGRKEHCPWCQNDKVFGGQTVSWEWTSLANGKTYDLVDIPLTNPDGSVSKLEIFHEISEHKKTAMALKEKQEQLGLALQSANLGVWSLDIKSNLRSFDKLTCSFLGINPENFKGNEEEFYSVIHANDRDKVRQAMAKAIKDGQLYEPGYRVKLPDGSLHYITSRGRVLYDAQGKPEKVTGVVWDISKNKLAEEQLFLQRKFTWAVLENIEAGVVACNEKGELILFNQLARQWHGMPPLSVPQEDWAGRYNLYFEDGVTPMDLSAVPLVRAFRGENVPEISMVIAAKDQPKRSVVTHASPIKSEDGLILGAVAVMHDITASKKVEAELKERLRELEIFNKAAVGREERIVELKKEVENLKKKL
jgi:PAS domain S-box-containing protein